MLTLQENRPFKGSPKTTKLLGAAEGYAYLGLYREAWSELESIAPDEAFMLEVLIAKAKVLLYLGKFQAAERMACLGMKNYPHEDEFIVQRLFALTMSGLDERAAEVTRMAPEWIMRTGIVHYNLACYFLKFTGDLTFGRECLGTAIRLNSEVRKRARKDRDLADLWT